MLLTWPRRFASGVEGEALLLLLEEAGPFKDGSRAGTRREAARTPGMFVDCRRRIADIELFTLRVCRCDSDEVDGPLWSRVNDVRTPGAGGGRAEYL